MIIPIFWKEFTCTVSGWTYKFVECENCKQHYVYRMVRHIQGQGSSLYYLDNEGAENRAKANAHSTLQNQLDNDCDPVPCLKCGWYQANMVKKLRDEYRIGLYWTGVGLTFAFVILAVLGWLMFWGINPQPTAGVILLIAAGASLAGGLGSFVYRRRAASRYEPNDAPAAERIFIAEGIAQTRDEFEKWLKEQGIELQSPAVDAFRRMD